MRWICFLRGINVNGQRLIAMPALREALGQAGLSKVESYIQSGNLVFESAQDSAAASASLSGVLESEFGHDDVEFILLSREQLEAAVAQCPATGTDADTSKWHFTFLLGKPANPERADADRDAHLPERYYLNDRVVYAHCPNGYARTKIGNDAIERKFKVKATTRNWNTVQKMIQMAAG